MPLILTLPTVAELQPGKPIKSEHATKFRQSDLDLCAAIQAQGLPQSVFDLFTGNASLGDVIEGVTGNVANLAAGFQYDDYSIAAGVTTTYQRLAGIGYCKVGVFGDFAMTATSGLIIDPMGLSGGAAGTGIGGNASNGSRIESGGGFYCATGGGGGSGSNQTAGVSGSGGDGGADLLRSGGGGGASQAGSGNGLVGAVGQAALAQFHPKWYDAYPILAQLPGGGGGGAGNSGGAPGGNGGLGGRGGPTFILECGTFDFPAGATITLLAGPGGNGLTAGNDGGGGAGGGSGPNFIVLARQIISNLGTVAVAGGLAGTGGVNVRTGGAGALGGAGRALILEIP